jgi:hypothetical protein
MRAAPALLALAVGVSVSPAAAGPSCVAAFWAVQDIPTLTLGTVKPTEKRAYFISDEPDACPSAAAACRRKDYLIAGDAVVIRGRSGDFVCATFANAKGTVTAGWLPAAAIDTGSAGSGSGDFIGRWNRTSASIRIGRAKGGRLSIEGDATYPTAGGSVNLGEIALDAAPKDGELYFGVGADGKAVAADKADTYDCVARLRRLGPYLVVADNLNCGGHNVTFSGIYTKR